MTTRTTSRSVTFESPFHLAGFDGDQAPGTYRVETTEELIQSLSFPAWRRTATTLHLPRSGAIEFVPIDPVELEANLMRDAGLTIRAPAEAPEFDEPVPPAAAVSDGPGF